jgi:hypothetical protein
MLQVDAAGDGLLAVDFVWAIDQVEEIRVFAHGFGSAQNQIARGVERIVKYG